MDATSPSFAIPTDQERPTIVDTVRSMLPRTDPFHDLATDHAAQTGENTQLWKVLNGGQLVGYFRMQRDGAKGSCELVLPCEFTSPYVIQSALKIARAHVQFPLTFWTRGHQAAMVALHVRDFDLPSPRRVFQMLCNVEAPHLHLTTASLGDIDRLVEIHQHAFANHPDRSAISNEELSAHLRAGIRNLQYNTECIVTASRQDTIAGFAWLKANVIHDNKVAEVYVLAVDPAFHRNGIGIELLQQAKSCAHSIFDVTTLMLYVDDDNPRAIALYEKVGFTTTDQTLFGYSVNPDV